METHHISRFSIIAQRIWSWKWNKSKQVDNVDFTSLGNTPRGKWTAGIPRVSVSPKDDEINHQSQMVEKLKEQMLKQEEVRELYNYTALGGLTEWQTVSLQSQVQQLRVITENFLASETKAFASVK